MTFCARFSARRTAAVYTRSQRAVICRAPLDTAGPRHAYRACDLIGQGSFWIQPSFAHYFTQLAPSQSADLSIPTISQIQEQWPVPCCSKRRSADGAPPLDLGSTFGQPELAPEQALRVRVRLPVCLGRIEAVRLKRATAIRHVLIRRCTASGLTTA